MKITVNGEERETNARTIAELCRELGLAEAKIATARNGEFIPTGGRAETALEAGDKIEVLSPRAGG